MHGNAGCFRPRQENGPDAPGQAPVVINIEPVPCKSPLSAGRRPSDGHGNTDGHAIWARVGMHGIAVVSQPVRPRKSGQQTGRTLPCMLLPTTEYTSQTVLSRSLIEWGPRHSCMSYCCAAIIRHSLKALVEWWPCHCPGLCSGRCKSRQHTHCIPPAYQGPCRSPAQALPASRHHPPSSRRAPILALDLVVKAKRQVARARTPGAARYACRFMSGPPVAPARVWSARKQALARLHARPPLCVRACVCVCWRMLW